MKKLNKEKSLSSIKQINLTAYAHDDKGLHITNEEELKFLIDTSIYSMFGYLEANKIKYFIKKDENLGYILKAYEKHLKKIKTSILMINTVDFKIRIKVKE